jgi:hypothetical protein
MLDESLLARALPRAAHDASSRALDEIMHLAQSAKYEPAALRAGELLESGCKDVRAFVVYALGVFAERGPASVPPLFDSISNVLSASVSETPVPASALRTTDTTLRFGFRILKAHLDFDERRPEAARKSWTQRFESGSSSAVLRACADLRKAIHSLIEMPVCDAELGAVVERLEAYCARNDREKPDARAVAALGEAEPEPEPEPEGEEPSPVEVGSANVPPQLDAPEPPRPEPSFARRASDFEVDPRLLVVSPALAQFIRKLEVFEQLVTSGSLGKAAIVASDIRNVIAAFDPVVYLPSLLAPHFRLVSSSAEDLSQYSAQSGTPAWQALEQLYRVDIDAFVEA